MKTMNATTAISMAIGSLLMHARRAVAASLSRPTLRSRPAARSPASFALLMERCRS